MDNSKDQIAMRYQNNAPLLEVVKIEPITKQRLDIIKKNIERLMFIIAF